MVRSRPSWNSPRVKPQQVFSKTKPLPVLPSRLYPVDKTRVNEYGVCYDDKPKGKTHKDWKGQTGLPASVTQCHASIKAHSVSAVQPSRGTWRNIFYIRLIQLLSHLRASVDSWRLMKSRHMTCWTVTRWSLRTTATGWQTFNALRWKPFAWFWFEKSLCLMIHDDLMTMP